MWLWFSFHASACWSLQARDAVLRLDDVPIVSPTSVTEKVIVILSMQCIDVKFYLNFGKEPSEIDGHEQDDSMEGEEGAEEQALPNNDDTDAVAQDVERGGRFEV